jgi:hypothetical protein
VRRLPVAILIALLLLLTQAIRFPVVLEALTTYVASVSAGSSGGGNVTTGNIDLSSCTNCLIVCGVADLDGSGTTAITDSQTPNVYTKLTISARTAAERATIFYKENANVDNSVNFSTTTGAGSYPALACAGYKDAAISSAFDQQAGGTTASADPWAGWGTVTPTTDNQVVVGAVASQDATVVSITGYNVRQTVLFAGGDHYGIRFFDVIQTTAAEANPSVDWDTTESSAGRTATFKTLASTTVCRGMLLGVGC